MPASEPLASRAGSPATTLCRSLLTAVLTAWTNVEATEAAAGCKAQGRYGCCLELESWGLQALKGPPLPLVICQQDRSCGRRSLSSRVCCPQTADLVPDSDGQWTISSNIWVRVSGTQRWDIAWAMRGWMSALSGYLRAADEGRARQGRSPCRVFHATALGDLFRAMSTCTTSVSLD